MIDDLKYEEILDSGLILDHYLLLRNIKNGVKPVKNKRIQGFINLLIKKGYLEDENTVGEMGLDLLLDEHIQLGNSTITTTTNNAKDFVEWAEVLYSKCQARLEELTGKKQKRPLVGGKHYSFMPGQADFIKKLNKTVTLYKLTDLELVEKTLLKYIENCNKDNEWTPLLAYYIGKTRDGLYASDLATDIDNPSEDGDNDDYISNQKLI